jgi:hypothetical protein
MGINPAERENSFMILRHSHGSWFPGSKTWPELAAWVIEQALFEKFVELGYISKDEVNDDFDFPKWVDEFSKTNEDKYIPAVFELTNEINKYFRKSKLKTHLFYLNAASR